MGIKPCSLGVSSFPLPFRSTFSTKAHPSSNACKTLTDSSGFTANSSGNVGKKGLRIYSTSANSPVDALEAVARGSSKGLLSAKGSEAIASVVVLIGVGETVTAGKAGVGGMSPENRNDPSVGLD